MSRRRSTSHSKSKELQIADFKLQIGGMNPLELKIRTKQFALRILKSIRALPKSVEGRAIAGQLVRSGMSVAANYRASSRPSKAEFVAKIGVTLEEADETQLWLELIIEGGILTPSRVRPLLEEANSLRFSSALASRRPPI